MADYSKLISLEKKPRISPPIVSDGSASLLANQQTSKEVSQQTSKLANQQISKLTKKFTGKEANQQTSILVKPQTTKEKKKYGTYLKEETISAIQMLAIQTKRKDHEILQEIVDTYFASKK